MGSDPSLISFASRAGAAERLSDFIEAQIARGIGERGRASIAVSGGSTPESLYRALSKRALDWSRVAAALVDERWVAPGMAGSNETFIRDCLQANRARDLEVIGLWSPAPTPQAGLAAALERLGRIEHEFDVVVLGMGADGHTASWFPYCDGLDDAISAAGPPVAAVRAKKSGVTGDYLDRLTLTLGAIAAARSIILLISGDEKLRTWDAALAGGAASEMPVRAILRARPDIWVCWTP